MPRSPDDKSPFSETLRSSLEWSQDLSAALLSIYDEFIVVELDGKIVCCSGSILEDFWDMTPAELLGANYLELEKKILLTPSVFHQIVKQPQKTSVIHETLLGQQALAVGIPVLASNGQLERIIIASRDLSESTEKHLISSTPSSNSPSKRAPKYHPADGDHSLVIGSSKMRDVLRQAEKVAQVSATVLLVGESGVGKEMIASAIHRLGERSNQPFVKVNCGAIPEKLLESELFGYKRGAFTGADPRGKAGYFTQANNGIIFLDEISELPLSLQVKLLRVLQEREIVPLGGLEPIKINVQVIAATNKSLESLVESGAFREDLFYRLNVVPLHIPALRERSDEIDSLTYHFLQKYNQRYRKNIQFTPDAIDLLKVHQWPGNVRELENCIERVVVTCEQTVVDAKTLKQWLPNKKVSAKTAPIITTLLPLQDAFDYVEEQLILKAMDQYKSIKLAAQVLEVSQPTMSRKYQKIRERLEQSKLPPGERNESLIFEEELDKLLRSVATVTATSLNADEVKELLANLSENNPVYSKLRNRLTSIRELEGKIEWNYIFTVTPDKRIIHVVTDKKLNLKPGKEYIGPPEIMDAFYDAMKGKVKVSPRYTDEYGTWKTSVAPIKDETGKVIAFLGSDFSIDYVTAQVRKLSKMLRN